MAIEEIKTLDGYTIDIDDNNISSFKYYILKLVPEPEALSNLEVFNDLQHMDLISWKLIINNALSRFHGIVGASINIDYLKLLDVPYHSAENVDTILSISKTARQSAKIGLYVRVEVGSDRSSAGSKQNKSNKSRSKSDSSSKDDSVKLVTALSNYVFHLGFLGHSEYEAKIHIVVEANTYNKNLEEIA